MFLCLGAYELSFWSLSVQFGAVVAWQYCVRLVVFAGGAMLVLWVLGCWVGGFRVCDGGLVGC